MVPASRKKWVANYPRSRGKVMAQRRAAGSPTQAFGYVLCNSESPFDIGKAPGTPRSLDSCLGTNNPDIDELDI